ncbi:hypothetical protein [Wukongibacter sp. M2B1]
MSERKKIGKKQKERLLNKNNYSCCVCKTLCFASKKYIKMQ